MIGAGAWGVALAVQAARAGNDVTLWTRRPQALLADGALPRLPGVALPTRIRVTTEMPHEADAALLAVPMQHLRHVATGLRLRAPLIACCKGLEQDTRLLPLELLADLRPGLPLGVLSGPNFAAEVARGLPAAAVLACDDAGLTGRMIGLLATATFRLYASDDPIGVQVGGAAKNVIGIAAGAAIGAGLGENARAALMTRGIAELGRLIVGVGGSQTTAAGLSGLGDLVLTCTSLASRNTSLGVAIGRGESLAAILARRSSVAEGVQTAPALAARATSLGIEAPIIEAVSLLLTGAIDLAQAQARLLGRPAGREAPALISPD